METQRRAFSEEFKKDAVRRLESRDCTFSQVARELGVSRNLLQLWRKKYGTPIEAPTKTLPSESLEEENRRLRRENASLREDREVLKKAAAFFAKESR
jgi:transposase